MLVLGSDAFTLLDAQVHPVGPRHAVGDDGRVRCSDARPRFTFPVMLWDECEPEDRCPSCTGALAAETALPVPYPSAPVLEWDVAEFSAPF